MHEQKGAVVQLNGSDVIKVDSHKEERTTVYPFPRIFSYSSTDDLPRPVRFLQTLLPDSLIIPLSDVAASGLTAHHVMVNVFFWFRGGRRGPEWAQSNLKAISVSSLTWRFGHALTARLWNLHEIWIYSKIRCDNLFPKFLPSLFSLQPAPILNFFYWTS